MERGSGERRPPEQSMFSSQHDDGEAVQEEDTGEAGRAAQQQPA